MKLKLTADLMFGKNIDETKDFLEGLLAEFNKKMVKEKVGVEKWFINNNTLTLTVTSEGKRRAHEVLLQLRKTLSEQMGKKYRVGVRNIKTKRYEITFEVEKKPLQQIKVPFAEVSIKNRIVKLVLEEIDGGFFQEYFGRLQSHDVFTAKKQLGGV